MNPKIDEWLGIKGMTGFSITKPGDDKKIKVSEQALNLLGQSKPQGKQVVGLTIEPKQATPFHRCRGRTKILFRTGQAGADGIYVFVELLDKMELFHLRHGQVLCVPADTWHAVCNEGVQPLTLGVANLRPPGDGDTEWEDSPTTQMDLEHPFLHP